VYICNQICYNLAYSFYFKIFSQKVALKIGNLLIGKKLLFPSYDKNNTSSKKMIIFFYIKEDCEDKKMIRGYISEKSRGETRMVRKMFPKYYGVVMKGSSLQWIEEKENMKKLSSLPIPDGEILFYQNLRFHFQF